MLLLEGLEVETDRVLAQELVEFVGCVEGRCRELEAPPGSVVLLLGTPWVLGPRIVDHNLVVIALAEGPGAHLIDTVVDDRHIGIGRVRVQGLTLGIVKDKLLISVNRGNERSCTHSATFLGHERLHALEVVRRVQFVIVHVSHLLRVVLNALMETRERVVVHGTLARTSRDRVHGQVKTVEDPEAAVLNMLALFVQVHRVLCATEALLLAVLMNAPKDINALIDRLLIAELAEKGGCDGPEANILQLQFEKGYMMTKYD